MESRKETQIQGRLGEVARLFLRLGFIAFGGPAAHIALMRDEVVRRRSWVTDRHFLDLLGATNLIPGPNSTEMAIHLGLVRAGWRGLLVGGLLFILPATGIVLLLAWLYARYNTVPEVGWLLYGIKPVIVAIVAQALLGLGRTAVKGPATALIGAGVIAGSFLGANELLLLLAGGGAALLATAAAPTSRGQGLFTMGLASLLLKHPLWAFDLPSVNLAHLFLLFLKFGSVLYGSGYVLFAFVRADLVERLGWLTDQQLIDAVAVGQVTPGPVFTTATFIGYLVGSWWGALLATAGIFLPSFILVVLTSPLIPHLRRSRWLGAALDGVIVASLGLMAAVTYQLGDAALVDPFTIALLAAALIVVFRTRVNSAWVIAGGGALGLLYKAMSA